MKSLMFLVTALLISTQAFAQLSDEYFTIKSITTKEVPEAKVQMFSATEYSAPLQVCNKRLSLPIKPLAGATEVSDLTKFFQDIGVLIDQIVNVGQKIWNIVELGKPVVNLNMPAAQALPYGIDCWMDLEGWQMPESHLYEVSYTNGYDQEVVKFSYRIVYTYGGNLKGLGRYITQASITPAELVVAWGFNFKASVIVPSVFNMGTTENPVAGMQMVLSWDVSNILKHSQMSETFYVNGNGAFKKME